LTCTVILTAQENFLRGHARTFTWVIPILKVVSKSIEKWLHFMVLFSLSVYSPSLANVKPLSHFANDFVIWTLFFPFLWFLILSFFQKYLASDISSVRKETFMPFVWYLPFFFFLKEFIGLIQMAVFPSMPSRFTANLKRTPRACIQVKMERYRVADGIIAYHISLMEARERNKGRKMYTSVWKL